MCSWIGGFANKGRLRVGDYRGVLRSGEQLIADAAYLPARADQLFWGRLPSRADGAVASIAAGQGILVDTVSHEGVLEDQGRDPVAFFASHGVKRDEVLDEAIALAASDHSRVGDLDGPHVVTGPIEVRGAMPGDVLAVTLTDLTPRVPYGVISNRHGRGCLAGEFPQSQHNVSVFSPIAQTDRGWVGMLPRTDGAARDVTFPLAPFLGIVGVTVDSDDRPHSVPPGAHGGNFDVKEAVQGTTIYLPVQVPGAGLYVGDPHFAQGDGEVALTALEASLRAHLTVNVIPADQVASRLGAIAGPVVESDEFLIPTGMDLDLDEAVRKAVRSALELIGARWGMEPHLAYAYLSAAADVRISQVVDQLSGAHVMIRKADFEAVP
jgi:acetamidase/formamidase